MSSRLRSICIAGLLVGCASVVAVGCGSDASKKVTHTPVGGDAGEAGESAGGESATGGTGATSGTGGAAGTAPMGEAGVSEAGQGGASVIGAAGAGGAPDTSSAGAAGEPVVGEAGAGGAGPLACVPSGQTYGVTINADNQQTVCRGALVLTNITASDADQTFTCCGVSNTDSPYSVELTGVQGDSAVLSFVVPGDAPLGTQSISATCTSGAASNTFNVTVSDTLAPVVTQVETTLLYPGDTVLIDGSNFDPTSDRVYAVSVGGVNSTSECFLNQDSSSSSLLSCGFDGIAVGDYYITVQQSDCGYALNTPTITIQQSL